MVVEVIHNDSLRRYDGKNTQVNSRTSMEGRCMFTDARRLLPKPVVSEAVVAVVDELDHSSRTSPSHMLFARSARKTTG